jgi:RES domain-containing protein
MPEFWRIVKARHAATAFSGKGAADYGGRWNSRGVAVVYTSGTRALAALESLVHLNPPVAFKYVAIPARCDDALIESFSPKKLPRNWRQEPPARSTQRIGDEWVREARSAVLRLPSVIISAEPNYLINPAHPDFKKIFIGKPEPFTFDRRLLD